MAAISEIQLTLFVIAVTAKFTGAQLLNCEILNDEFKVHVDTEKFGSKGLRFRVKPTLIYENAGQGPSEDIEGTLRQYSSSERITADSSKLPGIMVTPQKCNRKSSPKCCCMSLSNCSEQVFYFTEMLITTERIKKCRHMKVTVKFSDVTNKNVIQVDMVLFSNRYVSKHLQNSIGGNHCMPLIDPPIPVHDFPENGKGPVVMGISWMETALKQAQFRNRKDISGVHTEIFSASGFAVNDNKAYNHLLELVRVPRYETLEKMLSPSSS